MLRNLKMGQIILIVRCIETEIGEQGFATDTIGGQRCIGTLKIVHEDTEGQWDNFDLDGYKSYYPNIKRGFQYLRTNHIVQLEVFGDCCWNIYSKPRKNGERQILLPEGNVVYPDFQPVSVHRLECEEDR